MNKNILLVLAAVILAILAYVIVSAPEGGAPGEFAGEVVMIDRDQVALDGPTLITVQAEGGLRTVAVPSMGIRLCAASGAIADVFALEPGAQIEVKGAVDEQGRVVPCESADHYLRVAGVAGSNATSTSDAVLEAGIGTTASARAVSVAPTKVLEDSRCPEGTACVQAGTVRIEARLGSGLGTSTQEFVLGRPVTTEAETVTLVEVSPASAAGEAISPEKYLFTFEVTARN